MSTLKATTIEPATGTNLTLGTTGDSVTVAGNLALDTWKDAGGNTLFVSNGSGTLSSVDSEFMGAGPKLILTQEGGGGSSVTFSSNIDNTYDTYMFVLTRIQCSVNGEDLNVNFSQTGSFSSENMTSTMFIAQLDQNDANGQVVYQSNADLTTAASQKFADSSQLGNESDENLSSIMYLWTPSSTSYVKQFNFRSAAKGKVPGSTSAYVGGYIMTTSAITQVQFAPSSGTFVGKISMYGVI